MGLSENAREERYAYYPRIISYVLRKIVTGYPETSPEVVKHERWELKWELRWSGASLVIGIEKIVKRA